MTLHVRDFAGSICPVAGPNPDCNDVRKPQLLERVSGLLKRFREARRRHRVKLAERQAALAIRLNGGVLTDELERRIARLMMGL